MATKKHEDWSDELERIDHLTPYNWTYVETVEVEKDGTKRSVSVPRRCMHFLDAPCQKLCPFGVISKSEHGPFKLMRGIQPTHAILLWGAQLHNLSTVLIIIGVILHLAAFVMKDNRKLLPGMFTGYVDKNYVKERHSLWYKELKTKHKN